MEPCFSSQKYPGKSTKIFLILKSHYSEDIFNQDFVHKQHIRDISKLINKIFMKIFKLGIFFLKLYMI
jgi:hypothetical protein